jgi:hypothetical protein
VIGKASSEGGGSLMEKRQPLETLEGHGRLVWESHSLPVRHDVSVFEYTEIGPDGSVQLTHREIEARIEVTDQHALAQANGREDLVLHLQDGRSFPCVLTEAQGSAGWLEGTGELSPRS